ncbi:MAG: hypothetical protein Q7U94_09790 [Sideroxyarcus sp.]|nr:hypothetical protein [Sideroxyarcus sp.]
MNPAEFYGVIEQLAREVVHPGPAQELILSHIAEAQKSQPSDPPAKGLLAELTAVADVSLITEIQSVQIRNIAYYWV